METTDVKKTEEKKAMNVVIRKWDNKLHSVEEASCRNAVETVMEQYIQSSPNVNEVIGETVEAIVIDGETVKFFDVQVEVALEIEEKDY